MTTTTGPIPPATADDLQFDLERGYRLWMEKHYESPLGIPGGAIGLIIRRCHAAEERVRELEGTVKHAIECLDGEQEMFAQGRREGIEAAMKIMRKAIRESKDSMDYPEKALMDLLDEIRALLDAEDK